MTLFLLLLAFFQNQEASGYRLEDDKILFYYSGIAGRDVYVSGNFNTWSKSDQQWKMQYDDSLKQWRLLVARSKVKILNGNFYEFTFRVDGELTDADKNHKEVIHCAGFGYRYIIHGL